ncbi:MAG: FAD-dependent oxidoreductase [Burkholderiales bacterium]
MARAQRILLVGGGHSHVEVLRRFALRPDPQVALTLVSPEPDTAYSGMLPGLVAGLYTRAEAHIALAPLARWAGARFLTDRVESLDLYTKTAAMADGVREPFDFVSLDVGSVPDDRVRGARAHAIGVKPVPAFLAAWERIEADAAAGAVRTIAVVGGGAAGIEVLLAMHGRLGAVLGAGAPRFALITDRPHLLPEHPRAVRTRVGRILVERGVALHFDSAAAAVEPGAVVDAHGRRIAADRIVWAVAASAHPWLAASGLACDDRGFVRVDDALRSPSHAFVFAAGDCAAQIGHPRPKSGVFAVRQGPPLAANLRSAAHGAPTTAFVPQRRTLALITTGGRHAIASRGPFVAEGAWVWRWKDRIDRRFMAKYVPPAAQAAVAREGPKP